MITCSGLLRRYHRWFLIFLIFLIIQILLIVLFYQIEENDEFKNLIKFNKKLSAHAKNRSIHHHVDVNEQ